MAETTFVDTHCHIDLVLERKTHADADALWNALEADGGIPEFIIHVACHPDGFAFAEALADTHTNVRTTFGVHPHDAKLWNHEVAKDLCTRMSSKSAVGWGEIGLDYHYDLSPRPLQRMAFEEQLALAVDDGRPVVLHTRDADEDTLSILRKVSGKLKKLHVHCFTGSQDFARALLECAEDVVFGFTGILTFRSASHLQDVARMLAWDRLLLETDSPYLAPVPLRGRTATPGMIPYIARHLASLKGVSLEEAYAHCRSNTRRIYGV